MKSVCDKIKMEMHIRGWSEYRLAQESGIPQSTINTMFHKYNNPSIYTLEAICKAFGITMGEFFHETESRPREEEMLMISLYRQLNPQQRIALLNMMRTIVATELVDFDNQKDRSKKR